MNLSDADLRTRVAALVAEVQSLPYVWPCPPDAESARRAGAGSCASKHALLAEELLRLEIESWPLLVTGLLVPDVLRDDPQFAAGIDLLEVHECLTVMTPWAAPLRVDVTWDPPLIARGLPGILEWDGLSDMPVAVGERSPGWSVPRSRLREAKEALRGRLYGPAQWKTRDETLRRLSARFESWRRTAG